MKKRKAKVEDLHLDIEARLTKLESAVDYVKLQVENHIPTELSEHRVLLESISRRMGDMDAVSRFLSIVVKSVAAMATLVWSLKNILPQWFHHD